MESIKILHCSDFHLGSELTYLGTGAGSRREELLIAFERIVAMCREKEVRLLLIAGDLFDGNSISAQAVAAVQKALSSIPETIVGISAGNHDCTGAGSPYNKDGWSENVHIFSGEIKTVCFDDLGLRLCGGGFSSPYQKEPLLQGFSAPDDELINIAVLHGELSSAATDSFYNPITPYMLSASNLDYAALGHVHTATDILKAGKTRYGYCGCPEGRGFDEDGEKGVFIGEVGKNHCDLEFVPTAARLHIVTEVDISSTENAGEIAKTVLDAIDGYADFRKNLYKIILIGETASSPDIPAIKARLEQEGIYFIKISDKTRAKLDITSLAEENSLRGLFTAKLIASGENGDNSIYAEALRLGLKAFDGDIAGGIQDEI